MKLKFLLSSLVAFFIVIGNVNASEVENVEVEASYIETSEQEEIIGNAPVINGLTDLYIEIGEEFDWRTGVTAYDAEDGDLTSSLGCGKGASDRPKVTYLPYFVTDSDGNRTIVNRKIIVKDTKTTTYKGEKLVTYFDENANRYKAELYYSTGELKAVYTYNDKSWVTYTEYNKNKTKKSYQSRYSNLKMKEKAWYYSNGKVKRMDNFYSNGRKKMYRTWSSTGKKTDQQNYYNQAKLVKSADYSYYSNGKVKECVKRYSNGKLKQRSWYYSTGKLKKVKNY